jgi:hypothetical protein
MQVGKPTVHSGLPEPIVWFLLVALTLFFAWLAWPATVMALSYPGSDGIPREPASQSAYITYLNATGRPTVSRYNGYPASYQTYAEKKLLVYGTPEQVPQNRYDARYDEYAYLGYSYDEALVTNSDFPDDSPTGATYTSPWEWQEEDLGLAAEISWARLTDRQRNLIQQAPLYYRQDSYGGMKFAQLGLTPANCMILTAPAWHLGFALYTQHQIPGGSALRYATFTGSGRGDLLVLADIEILTPLLSGNSLILPEGKDQVEIRYRLSGQIRRLGQLATTADIANCGVGNSLGWQAGSGLGPWTKEYVQTISRSYLGSSVSKPLTLSGQAWAVSWLGDIFLTTASQTIEVVDGSAAGLPIDLTAHGSLDYFAGRSQAFDYVEARDRHRYLGLETITFEITFSQPTQAASLFFAGQTWTLNQNGQNPATHFSVKTEAPLDRQTLDWQHQRLAKPLLAEVRAEALINGQQISRSQKLSDIEVTGDVYDLNRVLTG